MNMKARVITCLMAGVMSTLLFFLSVFVGEALFGRPDRSAVLIWATVFGGVAGLFGGGAGAYAGGVVDPSINRVKVAWIVCAATALGSPLSGLVGLGAFEGAFLFATVSAFVFAGKWSKPGHKRERVCDHPSGRTDDFDVAGGDVVEVDDRFEIAND